MEGFTKQPQWVRGICPYCRKRLGTVEKLKRKTLKFYRCRHCGNVVDERFLVW